MLDRILRRPYGFSRRRAQLVTGPLVAGNLFCHETENTLRQAHGSAVVTCEHASGFVAMLGSCTGVVAVFDLERGRGTYKTIPEFRFPACA